MTTLPRCSVVVPCRNEIRRIEACLDSLLANDYPIERLEIIVVDGASTDGTRELLARYAARHAHLSVVDNPGGLIPVAMNLGIRRSSGAAILKADAHAVYPVDYISRTVRGLVESGADNVGGVIDTCASGDTAVSKAIAGVLAHPLGSGNSRFRIGASLPMEADTVAFGCYRREALERVGGYNESLVRSSDMDLNTRLRASGGRIVLLPDIAVRYYPRAAFWSFVARNFVDGYWVTYPLKFGGQVLRLRHAVPLAALALLGTLAAIGTAAPPVAGIVAAAVALYGAAAIASSIQIAVAAGRASVALVGPAVFAARHVPYALGSAWGLLRTLVSFDGLRRRRAESATDVTVRRDADSTAWAAQLHGPMALSVIIPAFNEARRLPSSLDAIDAYLRKAGVTHEIIVVDDGSTDGTGAFVAALAEQRDNLRLIRFERNRGKGAAVKAGMLAGAGRYLIFTDADQSTSIDQLPRLLQPLFDGFDVAMGSRGLAESTFQARQRWYRRKLGDAFGILARLLLVRGFRDCQCGFKAFTRAAAVDIFTRVTSPTAIFDVEAVLVAARLRFRIAEIPVDWKHDPDSRIVYDLRRSIGVLEELFRLRRHWRVVVSRRARVSRARPVCPVCGRRPVRRWSVAARKPLLRCVGCGLEWFDRHGYAASHVDQYLSDSSSRSAYYTGSIEADAEAFGDRMERLVAESGRRYGRILDVGCSVGTFLRAASDRGWEAVGVEPNPAAADVARARGCQVVSGFFDRELAGRLGRFDAVHLSDVIEHVFDPVAMLTDVRRVLAPGGVLLVTTPDFDTVSGRLLQRKPAEHVVHFRRGSLIEAAVRAGFEVTAVERISRPRSLSALRHSTTFGPVGRALLRMASSPAAAAVVGPLVALFCRDTLLLSARLPLAASHEACA